MQNRHLNEAATLAASETELAAAKEAVTRAVAEAARATKDRAAKTAQEEKAADASAMFKFHSALLFTKQHKKNNHPAFKERKTAEKGGARSARPR